MNILFVCTSNKDRSPALERHFREKYPEHEYRSAGINRYYTQRKGTKLISEEDGMWANLIVCAEDVHLSHALKVSSGNPDSWSIVLGLGDYDRDNMQQYVLDAEKKILDAFPQLFNQEP